VENNILFRSAILSDSAQISNLVNTAHFVHRHLDWHSPEQWIGHPPYWVIEKNNHIVAGLACPPDPTGVSWIRLFISSLEQPPDVTWRELFRKVLGELKPMKVDTLVAIAIQDWFEQILEKNGFDHIQDVVVLRHYGLRIFRFTSMEFTIRIASKQDIPAIVFVDHAAFSPLWQMPEDAIAIALEQPYLATIAEHQGQIMGYQISTYSGGNVHLARLAVLPELQNMCIGKGLVSNLLENCKTNHIEQITVNTQGDNIASLALYKKMGFLLTGDRFPVFSYRGLISK
jgi:ribosomal protein S18 acetylase RimI-like enzyme